MVFVYKTKICLRRLVITLSNKMLIDNVLFVSVVKPSPTIV